MSFEDRLKAQIKDAEEKLKILSLLPDLDEEKDIYGVKRLSSRHVNDRVDKIELKLACDCCTDADLLAYTFMDFNGIRVYSDPPSFTIGKRKETGIDTNWGWEDQIFDAGLSAEIIMEIQERLNKLAGEHTVPG